MYTARQLRRRLRRGEVVVMLVNPRGFMTYQPFLAEAAAGTIEPRYVVTSLRRVLPGTEVLTGRQLLITAAEEHDPGDVAGRGLSQ